MSHSLHKTSYAVSTYDNRTGVYTCSYSTVIYVMYKHEWILSSEPQRRPAALLLPPHHCHCHGDHVMPR